MIERCGIRAGKKVAGLALPVLTALGLLLAGGGQADAATGTRVSSFAYTSDGLLNQEVVEPNTPSARLQTDYTYDGFGNKVSATVSGSGIATRTTTTGYDAEGRFVTTNTNALGQSETIVTEPKFGNVVSQTGPNGITTTWTYDAFGRKTRETRADGTRTDYAYVLCQGVEGGTGQCSPYAYVVFSVDRDANGNNIGPIRSTYYDRMDRVKRTVVQGPDGTDSHTETIYNAMGQVAQVSRPYHPGSPVKWTVNAYDVLGRVTSTTLPDGSVTTVAYHGQTTVTTNDKGQTKTEVKNARGLTESVTDANGKTVTYAYDPFDNLTSTTDSAGNVIANSYDIRGNKTAMTDPDMGSWSYSYNVLGELVSQTDAKSQTSTFSYDLLGRMVQRVEPGLTSTWEYDTAPNGVGKLAEAATNAGYSRIQSYDSLGRPISSTTTIMGDTSTISTAYDATTGRVSEITYPTGFVLEYVYSAYGYNTELRDASTQDTIWQADAYDASMQITQETAGNALITSRTYDPDTGFLAGVQTGIGGAVANFTYTYDTLSNLTGRTDANQSLVESFTYDNLNRVTQYAIQGGSTKTVTYDDLGNITSKSDVGTYAYPAAGQARPHAVSAITPSGSGTVNTTYSYDANGNMTAGNGRTATWTSFNKVATITRGTTSVVYDYNGEHTRIRQVSGTEATLYINDPASGVSVEKVLGSSGSVRWNLYVRAGSRLVAQRINVTPSGGTTTISMRYFTTDNLGSIAVVTDELGSVVERLSYDAWGKRRFPDGTDDPAGTITSQTTRGFTGHEMIDEVGLVNMNGRIYDPQIGRFMSADPIVQDPTNTQSLNRYSYVQNNPLSYTDPTGYFSIGKIIGIVVAVVVAVLLFQPEVLGFIGTTLGVGETAAAVVAGAIGGAIAGGITGGGDLRSILVGAASGAAFAGLGSGLGGSFKSFGDAAKRFVAYGFTGGVTSVAQGGKFQTGFLAAGFSAIAQPYIDQVANDNVFVGTAASAAVGGTASVLGGGKFANGAVSGAFSYATAKAFEPAKTRKCQVAGPAVCSFDDSGPKDMRITENQRNMAAQGNVEGYYRSRMAQGDPVAQIGLASLDPPGGLLDFLFGGASVNNRLEAFSRVYQGHSVDIDAVRTDLMNANVRAIDADMTGTIGLLSPGQVYDYHIAVFSNYGLPTTTFGGSPFTGQRWEAYATRGIWCGGCDR